MLINKITFNNSYSNTTHAEYPNLAEHMSTYMAESLFKTSDLFLKSADKKKMAAKFMENELAQISENVRTLIKLRGRSTKRWFLFEGYFY